MKLEKIEHYRRVHPMGFEQKPNDPYGWFEIPSIQSGVLRVMVAPIDDPEWQHVSISKKHKCPTWEEMCFVKDLIWGDDSVVVQFHPKKSEYINNAETCLHLWCYKMGDFPTPPSIRVGLKL